MNQLKTVLLLGALSALLIVIGAAISPGALWLFAGLAVAMNLAAYFWSDKLVLRMNRAREVSEAEAPRLHRIVDDLARQAGIPKPRVYVVEERAPNAFATGRNPEHGVVAVTTGILALLSERELRGVLAHELAHIRNRDVLIASVGAMIASSIAMVASVIKWGFLLGMGGGGDRDQGLGGALGALVLAIVAPIAATIIQLAISRSREYGADASGAGVTGDPLALAGALEKLERGNERNQLHTLGDNPATASLFICSPLSGAGGVAKWFSTHPPIPERVKRLEEMATEAPAPRVAPRAA